MVKKKKEKKKKKEFIQFSILFRTEYTEKRKQTRTHYMHPKYYITKEPLAIEFQINHNRVTK